MLQKRANTKNHYVSCIKINGVPIIAPLMTSPKRKEMQLYREEAIKLEKQLQRERELREEIKKYSINVNEKSNSTLEHQLTFNENELVPFIVKPIESQDNSLMIDSFKNESQECCDCHNCFTDSDSSACIDNGNITVVQNDVSNEKEIPKLIRSNSYTLDSPSPLLLEHFKNLNKSFSTIDDKKTITTSYESVLSTRGDGDFLSETEIYENDSNSDPFFTERSIEETHKLNEVFDNNFPANTKESIEKLDSDAKLKEILDNIPENYSKQILELLEKQKLDQENRLQTYYQIKDKLLNVSNAEHTKSLNETLETFSNPESPNFDMNNKSFMTHSDLIEDHFETPRNALTCSRILYMNDDEIAVRTHHKINLAASKIGAAAKGYLVRRLMKTEKVQGLIQTLKDALICAMELHMTEDIQPADVELHRRLIQQVSAACYAFNDVFFSFSIPQQMSIIALDRQKKQEKLKRPSSVASSRRSSNKSTPRSSKIGSEKRISKTPLKATKVK